MFVGVLFIIWLSCRLTQPPDLVSTAAVLSTHGGCIELRPILSVDQLVHSNNGYKRYFYVNSLIGDWQIIIYVMNFWAPCYEEINQLQYYF